MKLIDLDAEQEYLLDGKYKVKAGTDYVPIDEEWERGYTAGQMAEKQEREEHGKWRDMVAVNKATKEERNARQCSICGAAYFVYKEVEEEVPKYCPNCGARMDGEVMDTDDFCSNGERRKEDDE